MKRKVRLLINQLDYEGAEATCREILARDADNDDAATNLGYALGMQGKLDEALPWYERAAKSDDFKALGNYNLCCYYSRKADIETAFSYLEKAVKCGIGECLCEDQIQRDPDLENILKDPRFELALKSLCSYQASREECNETSSL